MSNGDRGQESDNPNIESDTTGLWNHNVSSDKLVTSSSDTDNAMLRLGWTKYYLDGNAWKQKRLFNNEFQIRTLQDVIGDPNYEMSINFLEPGDLICSNGHAEFYVGYNYRLTYNIGNNGKRDKKNGIESISIGDKAQHGYSTFGWGNVQYEFPKQAYRFTYESDKTFRWRQGSSGGDEKYKVIWRKN